MIRKALDPRVWIPGVLGILALTIPWISTRARQEARVPSPRPARIVGEEDASFQPAPEVRTEPAVDPTTAKEAVPSPETRKDPLRLRDWLIGLSLPELKPLVGTKKLDGYVVRALSSSVELDADATRFLDRLNERIRAAKSL